jgi:hypothetical protein
MSGWFATSLLLGGGLLLLVGIRHLRWTRRAELLGREARALGQTRLDDGELALFSNGLRRLVESTRTARAATEMDVQFIAAAVENSRAWAMKQEDGFFAAMQSLSRETHVWLESIEDLSDEDIARLRDRGFSTSPLRDSIRDEARGRPARRKTKRRLELTVETMARVEGCLAGSVDPYR